MDTSHHDDRVTLTKGQFVKIFRWHRQLSMQRLAAMTELGIAELVTLENDAPLPADHQLNLDRLTALLGCDNGLWDRVGIEPGFPGTEANGSSKTVAKSQITFATHINRIAAMPDSLRHRQMLVIQRELTYIDG